MPCPPEHTQVAQMSHVTAWHSPGVMSAGATVNVKPTEHIK